MAPLNHRERLLVWLKYAEELHPKEIAAKMFLPGKVSEDSEEKAFEEAQKWIEKKISSRTDHAG